MFLSFNTELKMKIEEMTEEEVLNHVATGIHDYLMRIRPHGEFILDVAVRAQIAELKRLYSWSYGVTTPRGQLSREQLQELDQIIAHLEPQMTERARAVQLHYSQNETIWQIQSTSAKAQIEKAFKDKGIKVTVDAQRYRARVLAYLGGHTPRFYVGFKALEKGEEVLEGVVQAVLDMRDALVRLGTDVKVSK